MVIYIHGFNSSALSYKAGLVRKRMQELRRSDEYFCPELPPSPGSAIELLEATLEREAARDVALIGSSLGGYYATWLAECYGVRAVLLNPAVRPYDLLKSYVGPQKNLYTGVDYELAPAHVEELRELEVERVTPSLYLLMVTTGDEVLNYQDALAKYRGCERLIVQGGDHGFGSFDDYVDRALAFCGIAVPGSPA